MDSTLRPSDKSQITFVDTGKGKVLGLGRIAISKDQHMDKVMLVESLGFNLMSVSMLCDLKRDCAIWKISLSCTNGI